VDTRGIDQWPEWSARRYVRSWPSCDRAPCDRDRLNEITAPLLDHLQAGCGPRCHYRERCSDR